MKLKYFLISFFSFSFNIVFSQLMITEVYYNTPYNEKLRFEKKVNGTPTGEFVDAYKHHRGEFIEIYNYSDKDLSLKNWYLQDLLGVFWLPQDKIIKSGQLMVIAYSTPYYQTEFPQLFSTTIGKEDQIIYQDKIILRNKYESVKLGYTMNGSPPINKSEVRWDYQVEPGTNYFHNIHSTPNEFYNVKSIQYHSDPNYNSLVDNTNDGDSYYNNYKATPNPLAATYKPLIQNYETLVINDYKDNYSYLDWTSNVDELVNKICPINIEKIEQSPGGVYSGNGSSCFSYDSAGNLSAGGCSTGSTTSPGSSGYNTDELEAIKNSIAIYPNPTKASDNYNVSITWSGPALNKIQSLQVFNGSGGLVYSFTPTNGVNTTSFSLQNQLIGAFVANFILNTGQVVSKNILRW